MKRVAELGEINGKWGEFSMTIPGRVGYQCSVSTTVVAEVRVS